MFEWTGWRIDTVEFKIYVLERKLIKAEEKLDQLITLVGRSIKVKTLSSFMGLFISFGGLAMGRAARFFHQVLHDGSGQGGGGAQLGRQVGCDSKFN